MGFTDFDAAIAECCINYAFFQIGHRSRRQVEDFNEQLVKNEATDSTIKVYAQTIRENESSDWSFQDDATNLAEESEVSIQEVGQAIKIVRSQTLSRKRRRNSSSATGGNSFSSFLSTTNLGVGVVGGSVVGGTGGGEVKGNAPTALVMVNDDDKEKNNGKKKPNSKKNAENLTGAHRVKSLEFLFFHFAQLESGAFDDDQDVCTSSSADNCSLHHLLSEDSKMSANAARRVLASQLADGDVAATPVLIAASIESAMRTRKLFVEMLIQKAGSSPMVCKWDRFVGLSLTASWGAHAAIETSPAESGSALIMHCKRIPLALDDSSKCAVIWATHSLTSNSPNPERPDLARVCGAVEAIVNKRLNPQMRSREELSSPALPPLATGLNRSMLVFRCKIVANRDTFTAAACIRDNMLATLHERGGGGGGSGSNNSLNGFQERGLPENAHTPATTPANAFSVGMLMNDIIRYTFNTANSRQSLNIASFAWVSKNESDQQCIADPRHRPWAVLHSLDLKFEAVSTAAPRRVDLESGVFDELDVVATVVVAGDSAIPVPSALKLLSKRLASVAAKKSKKAVLSALLEFRSVLFMSGVQSTTINTFAAAVASREFNTSTDSTSKISDPDTHRAVFATPFQCFVVNHSNVPKMFSGTAWAGAYGAGYCCGSVASAGNSGKHTLADGRMLIDPIVIDEKQIDEFCAELGAYTVVPLPTDREKQRQKQTTPSEDPNEPQEEDDDDPSKPSYAVTPTETWGLPRNLIPGFHAALGGLCGAFDTLRADCGVCNPDSISSIQCLPFGPFTEAVPPIVSAPQSWRGFRDKSKRPHGGWSSYRPDNTLPELSILGGPISRNMRSTMTCSSDNCHETSDQQSQSVFVFSTQLGFLALALHRTIREDDADDDLDDLDAALQTLRECCQSMAGSSSRRLTFAQAVLTSDALVLFNAMMPLNFTVGEPAILAAFAAAPNAALCHDTRTLDDVARVGNLSPEELSSAKRFCNRLDSGNWSQTAELITMVHARASTFDNSVEQLQEAAATFDAWIQSLWLLHSDDGVNPPGDWSPLCTAAAPEHVNAREVMMVFTSRRLHADIHRREQRGCVFGMAFNAPNQLMSLLTGAFLADASVQVYRNEGNICLRSTCNALKCDDPSPKSTSPVSNENDAESYGSIKAKIEQARRQTNAWKHNNSLIFKVSKHAHFSSVASGLHRGSMDSFLTTKQKLETGKRMRLKSREAVEGSNFFFDAARKKAE
jgi:hypothetical protein